MRTPIASTATLGAVLAEHSAQRPDAQFLIAPETGRVLDYADLQRLSGQLDTWFDARGIGRGAKVALYLPNGLAASALFLATMAAGRVIAPLNRVSQPSQLAYVLSHCDAAMVLTDATGEAVMRVAGETGGATVAIEVVDADAIDAGPWQSAAPRPGATEADPDDMALLMYTSGTTGTPKGVALTHANLLYAARAVAAWHQLGPDDRVLSALPLYHINGQVIATLSPFVSGGSIVAPRRFSVSSWWDSAVRWRCTWLNMVPTIIAYLLNEADKAPPTLAGIRFGRSASAPLPAEHHQAFEARFGFPVIEAMGMTESASIVFCNPMPPGERRSGTPGLPCGVEAMIVDADGREQPDGERGEIWLRGPNVMNGYYKSAQQTAAALADGGWLRSGDLGYRDADGYFFVTGRLKELIIKGGENIAPREIDEALLRHPAVLEAAAVGVPDPNYGQEILVAVVLKDGAGCDEAELRAFCLDELGRYKTPKYIRFVDELPKGPSGKVQRLKLAEQ
ncbi:MAG: AMP-binding protein [Burkholderiaceae bacterium]